MRQPPRAPSSSALLIILYQPHAGYLVLPEDGFAIDWVLSFFVLRGSFGSVHYLYFYETLLSHDNIEGRENWKCTYNSTQTLCASIWGESLEQ